MPIGLRFGTMLAAIAFASSMSGAQSARLLAVEDLRLGAVGSDEFSFSRVVAVASTSDGHIIAITRRADGSRLQVFDARRRVAASRSFSFVESPTALAVAGDTVVTVTGSGEECVLKFYSVAGLRNLRDTPYPLTPAQRLALTSGGGSLLAVKSTTDILDKPIRKGVRADVEVLALSPRNAEPVSVIMFADSTDLLVVPLGSGRDPLDPTGVRSFGVVPPWAPRLLVAGAGQGVLLAKGRRFEIEKWDPSAGWSRSVAAETTVRHPSPAQLEKWLSDWRKQTPPRMLTDSTWLQIARESPRMPRAVIGGLLVNEVGEIAVQRVDLGDEPVRKTDSVFVDVLRGNGDLRGRFSLPPGTRIHAFSMDALLVSQRDSQQVAGRRGETGETIALEQIVRYRITGSR